MFHLQLISALNEIELCFENKCRNASQQLKQQVIVTDN